MKKNEEKNPIQIINAVRKTLDQIKKEGYRVLSADEMFQTGDLVYMYDGLFCSILDEKEMAKRWHSSVAGNLVIYTQRKEIKKERKPRKKTGDGL